jgi:hypothetical protein
MSSDTLAYLLGDVTETRWPERRRLILAPVFGQVAPQVRQLQILCIIAAPGAARDDVVYRWPQIILRISLNIDLVTADAAASSIPLHKLTHTQSSPARTLLATGTDPGIRSLELSVGPN